MHYFFRYLARNEIGDSLLSDESVFALAAYPAKATAPFKLDLESSLDSISLEWLYVPDGDVNVIGYNLYMDTGNDGNFIKAFDGKGLPGLNTFTATGLLTGKSYRFKVAALNFNGEGEHSDEVLFYSCLPPKFIAPPQYISSTETTLTVDWTSPVSLEGCPL